MRLEAKKRNVLFELSARYKVIMGHGRLTKQGRQLSDGHIIWDRDLLGHLRLWRQRDRSAPSPLLLVVLVLVLVLLLPLLLLLLVVVVVMVVAFGSG
jgi:hypothetical protein